MKKTILTGAMVAALSLGGAEAANAALLTIDGGYAGSIPGGGINELLPLFGVSDLSGYYGANLNVNGASSLTFEYFGFEAGYVNQFLVNGSVKFSTEIGDSGNDNIQSASSLASPLGSYVLSSPDNGLVPFSFFVNYAYGVANGFNLSNVGGNINFFLTTALQNNPTTADVIYIWLDDAGGYASGHSDDDNHDDMLIRVTATPVPEPASLTILGMALAGLGLLRRRSRKSAAIK